MWTNVFFIQNKHRMCLLINEHKSSIRTRMIVVHDVVWSAVESVSGDQTFIDGKIKLRKDKNATDS